MKLWDINHRWAWPASFLFAQWGFVQFMMIDHDRYSRCLFVMINIIRNDLVNLGRRDKSLRDLSPIEWNHSHSIWSIFDRSIHSLSFFRSDMFMFVVTQLNTLLFETRTRGVLVSIDHFTLLSDPPKKLINNNSIFSRVRHLRPCSFCLSLSLSPPVYCAGPIVCSNRGHRTRLLFSAYVIVSIENDHDRHARLSRRCRLYFRWNTIGQNSSAWSIQMHTSICTHIHRRKSSSLPLLSFFSFFPLLYMM